MNWERHRFLAMNEEGDNITSKFKRRFIDVWFPISFSHGVVRATIFTFTPLHSSLLQIASIISFSFNLTQREAKFCFLIFRIIGSVSDKISEII